MGHCVKPWWGTTALLLPDSVSEKTFAYWIKNMDEPVPLTLVNIGMLTWFGDSARFGTIPQQRDTVASTNTYAQCVHVPSECGGLL